MEEYSKSDVQEGFKEGFSIGASMASRTNTYIEQIELNTEYSLNRHGLEIEWIPRFDELLNEGVTLSNGFRKKRSQLVEKYGENFLEDSNILDCIDETILAVDKHHKVFCLDLIDENFGEGKPWEI